MAGGEARQGGYTYYHIWQVGHLEEKLRRSAFELAEERRQKVRRSTGATHSHYRSIGLYPHRARPDLPSVHRAVILSVHRVCVFGTQAALVGRLSVMEGELRALRASTA